MEVTRIDGKMDDGSEEKRERVKASRSGENEENANDVL